MDKNNPAKYTPQRQRIKGDNRPESFSQSTGVYTSANAGEFCLGFVIGLVIVLSVRLSNVPQDTQQAQAIGPPSDVLATGSSKKTPARRLGVSVFSSGFHLRCLKFAK